MENTKDDFTDYFRKVSKSNKENWEVQQASSEPLKVTEVNPVLNLEELRSRASGMDDDYTVKSNFDKAIREMIDKVQQAQKDNEHNKIVEENYRRSLGKPHNYEEDASIVIDSSHIDSYDLNHSDSYGALSDDRVKELVMDIHAGNEAFKDNGQFTPAKATYLLGKDDVEFTSNELDDLFDDNAFEY